jgi:nicotinate phosphoribosyltransferase
MNPRPPVSLWPDPDALGPATDLYELTMMAGYLASGMAAKQATFELFVRKMPPDRAYLVFAGLEQAIGDVLRLAFTREQIEAIRHWPMFRALDPAILDAMAAMRFQGDIHAIPEGTVVFPGEPLVRVTAPLPQAQWLETHLLASLAYPTLVASKAARIVQAARGRPLYEFGARRGHGPLAGFLAARASYIAGFAGTSHAEAARRLGIPASGTMAHSWVQSFQSESESFRVFAQLFPHNTVLLVDTFDTLDGVRRAAAITPPVAAIRIDSGDLEILATQARAILDEHGRAGVQILGSGDLDEFGVERLVAAGAPIDGFGVGTELITCRDSPALAAVYKLVELAGQGTFKLSPGKRTYPMAKQVYRRFFADGRFCGDLVAKSDEIVDGTPLLQQVVRSGTLVSELPSLEAIRQRCRQQLAALPDGLRRLDSLSVYPVSFSEALQADAHRLMKPEMGRA